MMSPHFVTEGIVQLNLFWFKLRSGALHAQTFFVKNQLGNE